MYVKCEIFCVRQRVLNIYENEELLIKIKMLYSVIHYQTKMSVIYNFLLENHLLATIEQAVIKRKSNLNLSRFEIEMLPEILFACQDVLRLHLHKNKLTNLNGKIMNLSALTTLTIDYNNLSSLPPEIGILTNLINLNVSHNPLKILQPEIGNLVNLEVLWCNKTDIESIPNEICKLEKLDTFGARGNRISRIPDELFTLVNLRWLTLENNSILEITGDVNNLESLIHLNLKGNMLTNIPASITQCKELRYLLLSRNKISELPVWDITKPNSLEMVDLRENPLAKNATWAQVKQAHPMIRLNDEWTNRYNETTDLPSVGNNTNNDITTSGSTINNENFTTNTEVRDDEVDDGMSISDDSSEDWENSVLSSDLDLTDSGREDGQDNEMVGEILPELSRFATTGS